ncbi:hypothetical protein GCK32_000092 [Trichostrongylus colubriformis]|uniref:Potassium channel tetramerisation-type BTB domain-containing protein n=1 Tax=Trichostrongylus colubriformis TaxID=6319 RepID=A0AAN8FJ99_TRICO
MPPRLGQSDDVVLDLPGLHHQIFDTRFRCKSSCVTRSSPFKKMHGWAPVQPRDPFITFNSPIAAARHSVDALQKVKVVQSMKEEAQMYKPEDIIRLNVGGQRFDTFLGTLLIDRTSCIYPYFAPLVDAEASAEQVPPKDSEGAFFLDRDPEHFRTLLNGLRYLVQMQSHSQNGTIKSASSEEDLRSGKESKGLWHRFRGK